MQAQFNKAPKDLGMKSITFTGGLGAQIMSASAYFFLKSQNIPVRANFDYFEMNVKLENLRKQGININNDISFFPWQIDELGLEKSKFSSNGPEDDLIQDGLEKQELAMNGLRRDDIKKLFIIPEQSFNLRQRFFGDDSFCCAHIRRGDYVRVATYLVSDDNFFNAINSTSKLVTNLLLLSDSPLSEDLCKKIAGLNINVITGIGGNPAISHGLMRLSNILISSNSQYSYTAAYLRNKNQLTFLPSIHDSGSDPTSNEYLDSIRAFQVLTDY